MATNTTDISIIIKSINLRYLSLFSSAFHDLRAIYIPHFNLGQALLSLFVYVKTFAQKDSFKTLAPIHLFPSPLHRYLHHHSFTSSYALLLHINQKVFPLFKKPPQEKQRTS